MQLNLASCKSPLQRQCCAVCPNPVNPAFPKTINNKTPLRQYRRKCTYQQICRTSATDNGAFVPVEWESDEEVHNEESLQLKTALLERFKAADTDGYVPGCWVTEVVVSTACGISITPQPNSHSNGVIDREELRTLLESTDGGQQMGDGEHWMSDDEVDRVMRQYSGNAGVLSFDQFARLV